MKDSLTKQDVLRAFKGARALISDRSHWTRHMLARGKNPHQSVEPDDPNAVRFCALGALQRSGLDTARYELEDLLGYDPEIVYPTINDKLVKDGGGHKAILSQLDKEITRLESAVMAEVPKPEKIEKVSDPEPQETPINA